MFEAGAHVGEEAELYALGQLDESQSARLQAHAAQCAQCARRIGEAEATVLRLIEAHADEPASVWRNVSFAKVASAPVWRWAAAVAAAFVLGLLPWGFATLQHRGPAETQPQQLAMNAMLTGHFLHAPLIARTLDAPSAKVIYGRTGGWLYVIVSPGSQALDVAVVERGTQHAVASVAPSQSVRSAYVALPGRAGEMLLLDRGQIVSSARLVYPK